MLSNAAMLDGPPWRPKWLGTRTVNTETWRSAWLLSASYRGRFALIPAAAGLRQVTGGIPGSPSQNRPGVPAIGDGRRIRLADLRLCDGVVAVANAEVKRVLAEWADHVGADRLRQASVVRPSDVGNERSISAVARAVHEGVA